MQYLGGKSSAAKFLVGCINPVRAGRVAWDAFCGGLSMSVELAKAGPVITTDINRALISLYKAVAAGWDPPTTVTEEQYRAGKSLPDTDPMKAFLGFGCSFGGKWYAGFARSKDPKDGRSVRGYASQCRNGLIEDIPALKAAGGVIECCNFLAMDPADPEVSEDAHEMILYLDSPYEGTEAYGAVAPFDHNLFWQRVRQWAALTDVFVSEYNAPFGRPILEFARRVGIHDAFMFVTCAAAISMGPPKARMAQTAASPQAAQQLMLLLSGCFGYLPRSPAYRAPKPDETVAEAIAAGLRLKPSPKAIPAIDAALVLCADHELNPATFVARITASSESDLHSCIASAIGTASGARIARACDALDQFFRGPVTLARLVPRSGGDSAGSMDIATVGFNHPLYPRGDPRAAYLLDMVRAMNSRSAAVRNILDCLDVAQKRHKQHARLETALAVLAIALEMPIGAASGLLTLARIAGWVAHIAEQRLGGFLIRPRAKFIQTAAPAPGFADGR